MKVMEEMDTEIKYWVFVKTNVGFPLFLQFDSNYCKPFAGSV